MVKPTDCNGGDRPTVFGSKKPILGSANRFYGKLMGFKPNRKFKKKYNRLFKKDPMGANMFLLLCGIIGNKGQG